MKLVDSSQNRALRGGGPAVMVPTESTVAWSALWGERQLKGRVGRAFIRDSAQKCLWRNTQGSRGEVSQRLKTEESRLHPRGSQSPAATAHKDAAPAPSSEAHLHSGLEVNSSRSCFKCSLQVRRLHGPGTHTHTHTLTTMCKG